MSTTTAPKPNRLAKEKSPYLLQHQHNPVDWFPWGAEAIEKAKKEDKLIFLSIGYSTCHWCHVMAHESFENDSIAKIMNENFVNIKVDREERPDVDRIYMTFVQATTGHGGWPLSVFLTSDLKPVFGATYLPPVQSYGGMPSFTMILERISLIWHNQRDKLLESGSSVLDALAQAESKNSIDVTDGDIANLHKQGKKWLTQCVHAFEQEHDTIHGGYGAAPKFPRPVILNFLFRMKSFDSCLFTLDCMAHGGIYDQVGHGFHRYSVDEIWQVPHFEKMLYDQAQLVNSYLDAFVNSLEKSPEQLYYKKIIEETLEYVVRDLRDASYKAFYSAEDADSLPTKESKKKREGAFYVFTSEEVEQVLSSAQVDKETINKFCKMYHVKKGGNVPKGRDPHHEFTNQNILMKSHSQPSPQYETSADMEQCLKLLFDFRGKNRPRPHLDDKTLTSWNGLMISAFARASRILGEEKYLQIAQEAAQFILTEHMVSKEEAENKKIPESAGNLYRTSRLGHVNKEIEGFLTDYAFFITALLDLYEASGNVEYAQKALELQQKQNSLFLDQETKCTFYETSGKDASIILRQKETYDGAEPSGNSVSCLNLLRLADMFDLDDLKQIAVKTVAAFQHQIASLPQAYPQLMCALEAILSGHKKLVIISKDEKEGKEAVARISKTYEPNLVIVHLHNEKSKAFWEKYSPYLHGLERVNDKATAQLCYNQTCQLPTNDLESVLLK